MEKGTDQSYLVHSRIQFISKEDPFYEVLCERVNSHFKNVDQSILASPNMIGKVIFLFVLFTGLYGLFISNLVEGWLLFFVQIAFYFSLFLVSVGIAHDGSHNAFSNRKWINKTFTMVFDLIGVNSFMWEFNHIESHHRMPNVPKYDSAIDSFKLFRFHPRADYFPIHKFQHLYIPIIYAFSTLFKVFVLDFYSFSRRKIGTEHMKKITRKNLIWLMITKIFVFGYMLVIPLVVLDAPTWQILAGFFCGHFVAGLVLGIVFMVTHVCDHSIWPEPDEYGIIHNSFARHILETTSDFCPQNRLLTWIAGGLNNHVAHHLFPRISQIHLPEVTKIVRQTAKEFDVKYKEYPTLYSAIRSHQFTLKKLGQSKKVALATLNISNQNQS